jgi:hypothetical protein
MTRLHMITLFDTPFQICGRSTGRSREKSRGAKS